MTQINDVENARKTVIKKGSQVHWLQLSITFLILIVVSFSLAFLIQKLAEKIDFPLYDYAWLTYLVVFGVSLISSLTIIAPVPFAVSVMIAAATNWNPLLIALFCSLGGTIGELSGYYAGYLGKKIAVPRDLMQYNRVERWINRYGVWAVFVLALQPVIPFDIGGVVAGTVKMPLYKFLPALWAGKFPKYIVLIYAGIGLIHFMPFLS